MILFTSIEDDEVRDYLDRLYHSQKKLCFAQAFRVLKNKHNAEDVVQQVYTKLAELLDNNDKFHIKNEAAFISALAKNMASNYLKANRQHFNIDAVEEVENTTFGDPEVNILRLDQVEEYTKKLEQLKPEYVEIIEFKYTEELSTKEISGLLNLPTDTVLKRLSRARLSFKRMVIEGEANE